MNNELISRDYVADKICDLYSDGEKATKKDRIINEVLDIIGNAPTVNTSEWVRKEDVIHSIAKQYSEHNELVPIWLSIGDMKGGAE